MAPAPLVASALGLSKTAVDNYLNLLALFREEISSVLASVPESPVEGSVDADGSQVIDSASLSGSEAFLKYLVRAETRYYKWLVLLNEIAEGNLTCHVENPLPPLDVWLLWQTHVIDPAVYVDDLNKLFGKGEHMLRFCPLFHDHDYVSSFNNPSVPNPSTELWETFTGEQFHLPLSSSIDGQLESTSPIPFLLSCPYCRTVQPLSSKAYVQVKLGFSGHHCSACNAFLESQSMINDDKPTSVRRRSFIYNFLPLNISLATSVLSMFDMKIVAVDSAAESTVTVVQCEKDVMDSFTKTIDEMLSDPEMITNSIFAYRNLVKSIASPHSPSNTDANAVLKESLPKDVLLIHYTHILQHTADYAEGTLKLYGKVASLQELLKDQAKVISDSVHPSQSNLEPAKQSKSTSTSPRLAPTSASSLDGSIPVSVTSLSQHTAFIKNLNASESDILPKSSGINLPILLERYHTFLILLSTLSDESDKANTLSDNNLPPLDVLFTWYTHMTTDTTRYADDISRLFGVETRDAVLKISFPLETLNRLWDLGKTYPSTSAANWEEQTGLPFEYGDKASAVNPTVISCLKCSSVSILPLSQVNQLLLNDSATCPCCSTLGNKSVLWNPIFDLSIDFDKAFAMKWADIKTILAAIDSADGSVDWDEENVFALKQVYDKTLQSCVDRKKGTTSGEDDLLQVDSDVLLCYFTHLLHPSHYLEYTLHKFQKVIVFNEMVPSIDVVTDDNDSKLLEESAEELEKVKDVIEQVEKEVEIVEEEVKNVIEVSGSPSASDVSSANLLGLDSSPRSGSTERSPSIPRSVAPSNVPKTKGLSVKALRSLFDSASQNVTIQSRILPTDVKRDSPISDVLTPSVIKTHVELLQTFSSYLSLARHQDKDVEGKVDSLYLVKSENRYWKWLCLLGDIVEKESVLPFPPVDCLLLWYHHMTHPTAYFNDLSTHFGTELAGKIMKTSYPLSQFLIHRQHNAIHPDADSQNTWENFTGEPFVLLHNADVVEMPFHLDCPDCLSVLNLDTKPYLALRLVADFTIECSACNAIISKDDVKAISNHTGFAAFSVDLVKTVQTWKQTLLKKFVEVRLPEGEDDKISQHLVGSWVNEYCRVVRMSNVIHDEYQRTEMLNLVDGSMNSQLVYLTHALFPEHYKNMTEEEFGCLGDIFFGPKLHEQPKREKISTIYAEPVASEERDETKMLRRPISLLEGVASVVTVDSVKAYASAVEFLTNRHITEHVMDDAYLAAAERRYMMWLALLNEEIEAESHDIVEPPFDVQFMMQAHMSSPQSYHDTISSMFPDNKDKIFQYSLPLQYHTSVPSEQSIARWESFTGEPFTLSTSDTVLDHPVVSCRSCGSVNTVPVQSYVDGSANCSACGVAMSHTGQLHLETSLLPQAKLYYHHTKALLNDLQGEHAEDVVLYYLDALSAVSREKKWVDKATADDSMFLFGNYVHMAHPASYQEFFMSELGELISLTPNLNQYAEEPASPHSIEHAPIQLASVSSPKVGNSKARTLQHKSTSIIDVAAVSENAEFIRRLIHSIENEGIEYWAKAEQRYRNWLSLLNESAGTHIPPEDVAQFWYLHMIHPEAYSSDINGLFEPDESEDLLFVPFPLTTTAQEADKMKWTEYTGRSFDSTEDTKVISVDCHACGTVQALRADSFVEFTQNGGWKCPSCSAIISSLTPLSVSILGRLGQLKEFLADITETTVDPEHVVEEYREYWNAATLSRGIDGEQTIISAIPVDSAIVLGHLTHCLRPFQYSNDAVAKFGTLFSLSSQLIPPVVNDKTEQKEDAHANVGVLNEEKIVRSLEVTDPVTVVTVADVRAHVKFVEKHVQAEELDFEYLAAAERRYLKWLAMLFDHLATGKDILCLVPPADVKLMMYTHMLLPDKYRNDMESIFGSHYSQLLFNYSFPLTDAAASSEEWESSTGESTLQSQQPVSVPCYSCGTVQMINLKTYVNLRFGAEVVICGGCGSSIHSANAAPNFSFDLVKTYCGLRKALIELAQTTDPLSDEQLAYAVFGYIGPNSTYYSGESGLFVKATHMLKPASYLAFYQGNISPFSDLIENVPVVLSDSRKAEVDLPETRNRNASISSSELRFESDVESVSSEVEQEKKLLTAESVINHLKLLEVLLDKDYGNDIPALIRSEARYLKWLTYIHGTKDWCAVPPADVALVAHIHTLRPVTFQKDLERLFGEASAHVISQHSLLNCPVEDFTVEVDTQSEYGFENYTGEPYFFNPASTALETEYLIACPSCVSIRSITQKEMVQLKLRQQPFVCTVCEVESTLEELRKRNRGVDPLDLDLISEISVWRSKMTACVEKLRFLLDDPTLVESLVASYHTVVDESVEKMKDSGSDTLASIMQLDDDLMFVHLTHLLFPAEYLDFSHSKFNRFVTFEPEPEAPKLVGLTVRPPLSPLPVAQSKPIAPPEPVHLIPDSLPRNHTDNFTLSSTLSRPEPVPDFSMDPETLLNYNTVIQFLLSAPEFRFKDSKLETLFWIRAQGRYMKYLSLLKLSIGKRVDPPVAPLDVLMLWMVHMLDTHRYIEDVIRLFDGEIKMLSFEFPIALLAKFIKKSSQPSFSAWTDFVGASARKAWEHFTGDSFQPQLADTAPSLLSCPYCASVQVWDCLQNAQLRSGTRLLVCQCCEHWMTLSTMSAWRLVNDLKKAKEGNGYIGGTILNLAKGKIDYKLAQLVNKLLLRTHDASLDQVLETALFSNEVINPWKNANLAAIIHDYIQSAVSKQFKGDLHKKISRRADVVASKIINYYQNIMTPFSLDLYSSLQNWRRLMSGIVFENSLTSKEEAIGVIERYDKYLRLIGQQSKSQGSSADIVAPAVDILLAHHAHMMEPLVYQKYCCYNFGKIMDFSRYTSKKELIREYETLSKLWQQKYSTPYDASFKIRKRKKGVRKVFSILFGSYK